jgi:hypothetical protein
LVIDLVAIQFDAEANGSNENNCRNYDNDDNNSRQLRLFSKFNHEKFEGFVSTVVQPAGVGAVFAGYSVQFQHGRIATRYNIIPGNIDAILSNVLILLMAILFYILK